MGLRVWSGGEIFSKKIDNKIGTSVGKQKTREGGGREEFLLAMKELLRPNLNTLTFKISYLFGLPNTFI